jgi:cysteine desulfurase
MAANNETGVIQDWQHIVSLCQKYSIPYFSDTTQWIGKTPFHFQNSGMDYAVMSGHKVGAMTGVGIVLAKDPSTLKPIIFGGGQERGLRGGTQNYLAIETLAVALKDNNENLQKMAALKQAREQFEASIKKQFPQVVIMGENAPRLATTTFISYPGIHGQAVQIELESQNIFVTTSSACSDNMPVTSKVLKAMKINDDVGRGVVRISLGPCAPVELYQELGTGLAKAYQKLEKIKFSGNRT